MTEFSKNWFHKQLSKLNEKGKERFLRYLFDHYPNDFCEFTKYITKNMHI